jgi:beta-lactamase class A
MPGTPLPPTLARLVAPDRGIVGLAARHVESAREWRWEDRRVLPSASLIKIPILAAFWDAVERAALDPAERFRVTADAAVDGSGVLGALEPGLTPTWRDLATLMIALSDNTATNLVIDRLGLGAIQKWIDGAGLADTRLARRMRDQAAAAAGRDNETSAADMLAILGEIEAGRCVSGPASAAMRAALGAQQHGDKLGRRLPPEVRLANKTGWIGDVAHDAGIVMWPGGTLVVAVLTRGLEPAWRASDLIGEVAVELVRACER